MDRPETNSLVMIAYYFPPDGSAAVYRPLRFVRHLSRTGWHPIVITQNSGTHSRYDPGLLESVPKETEVVRVADGDIWQAIQARRASRFKRRIAAGTARAELEATHERPARSFLRGIVRRAEAWFYYPDSARAWIRPATRATVMMCRQKHPKVLLVTGGPWSSFLVAHKASQRTGVPYVLDFRDSWTLTCNEDFEVLRPRWATRQDRRLLLELFTDAQAVVFRYESEAQCYWQAYPGALKSANIHIIPNGYEGAVERFEMAPGDKCTILYTGTVLPYRYDEFLEALSLLHVSFPAEARRLRVLFVGEGVENVGRAAALGARCEALSRLRAMWQ
jgi:glycosyltransferase involved in cell wall biosynthesis